MARSASISLLCRRPGRRPGFNAFDQQLSTISAFPLSTVGDGVGALFDDFAEQVVTELSIHDVRTSNDFPVIASGMGNPSNSSTVGATSVKLPSARSWMSTAPSPT